MTSQPSRLSCVTNGEALTPISAVDSKRSHRDSALEDRFCFEHTNIAYRFRSYKIKLIGNITNLLLNTYSRLYTW